jgi:large subunit ribosomal protein L29
MNAKELRQKSAAELKEEILKLRREQFNLRMGQATGQAGKPDQFSKVRRDVARIKTILGEQARSVAPVAAASAEPAAKPAAKKVAKPVAEKGAKK